MPSPPITPLAVMLGNGVLCIHWQPPTAGTVLNYEVQLAMAIDGPYAPFNQQYFYINTALISGLPMCSLNVYAQVRANFTDNTSSDWVQAKLGVVQRPTIQMACQSIRGSKIPAGSVFTVPHASDRLVGFAAVDDVNF